MGCGTDSGERHGAAHRQPRDETPRLAVRRAGCVKATSTWTSGTRSADTHGSRLLYAMGRAGLVLTGEESSIWDNLHLDSGTLLGYTKCRAPPWRLISTSSIFVRCNWPSHWDTAPISLSNT